MLAYLNGDFLPQSEAKIPITDRGWLYGDGVFETMRTYAGRPFKLAEHLSRLKRSATAIGLELPLDSAGLTAVLHELLERASLSQDVVIRVTVSRGAGEGGLWPTTPITPTLAIILRELPSYPPDIFSRGQRMITAGTRRNSLAAIDPRVKSANFLNNIMAKREAVEAGVEEALMVNLEGFVAECSTSNFFMVAAGTIITPTLTAGILPGITRELILDLCRGGAIPVKEELFTVEDIYDTADEAFITMTSAGLIPVIELDGRSIGSGEPGVVTRNVRRLFDQYVDAFQREEQ